MVCGCARLRDFLGYVGLSDRVRAGSAICCCAARLFVTAGKCGACEENCQQHASPRAPGTGYGGNGVHMWPILSVFGAFLSGIGMGAGSAVDCAGAVPESCLRC